VTVKLVVRWAGALCVTWSVVSVCVVHWSTVVVVTNVLMEHTIYSNTTPSDAHVRLHSTSVCLSVSVCEGCMMWLMGYCWQPTCVMWLTGYCWQPACAMWLTGYCWQPMCMMWCHHHHPLILWWHKSQTKLLGRRCGIVGSLCS